jgi:hypothetical protein
MEAGLVEEDVMLLMVDLQQLACLFRALSREALDVILWLLRSFEMNTGPRSHVQCCAVTREASLSVDTLSQVELLGKSGA